MNKLRLILLLLIAACSFGPGNIQTRHSTDLDSRRIRRIAVVPPSVLSREARPKAPSAAADSAHAGRDNDEMLAQMTYSAMAALPNWQIVSTSEVREVSDTLPPAADAARLKQIGQAVYADAVITGRMLRYRERVGDEWGAKSPASVAFVLELIDVRRGDVVWSARFDETQKSLSENIFALGDITRRGVRWLTAEQLTHEGVKKSVAQLHQVIARSPAR